MMEEKIQALWHAARSRFYHPGTHQFYDYLSSYETGRTLAHLPSAREVRASVPDEFGYGTGMEDCMISAGVLLSMVLDWFAATGEDSLRAIAHDLFLGIRLSATVHGDLGFLARGVCPEDGRSVYPASSRDQVTHALHGLWHYARSPLADAPARREVTEVVGWISDRMLRDMTAANGFESLGLDGARDTRGINRMWGDLEGHEMARLPMVYAIAWDLSGKPEYLDAYRKLILEAINRSNTGSPRMAPWTYPQMQCSLEVLEALETDAEIAARISSLRNEVAAKALELARANATRTASLDLTVLPEDWRSPEGGLNGAYREAWYAVRECGEMALTCAMAPLDKARDAEMSALLEQMLQRVDARHVSTCGIFHLLGGYWKIALRRERAES